MAKRRKIAPGIGQRLVIIEEKFGGIEKLIAKVGVHKNTYGNYVRGDRDPTSKFLSQLRDTTGANIDWLLTGEGDAFLADSPSASSIAIAGNERHKNLRTNDIQRLHSLARKRTAEFLKTRATEKIPLKVVDELVHQEFEFLVTILDEADV